MSKEKKMDSPTDYAALKAGGIIPQVQRDYFSLRLKVTGGRLSVKELLVIAAMAENYGNGTIHLTARQGVEIPFVPLTHLAEATKALKMGGLELGACGPRVRGVTACPGSAVCPYGAIDTQSLATKLAEAYTGRMVPHKFKIGVTGCLNNCLKAEENDLGVKGVVAVAWTGADCSRCGVCAKLCPVGAIIVKDGGVAIDQAKCIGCGDCVGGCLSGSLRSAAGYRMFWGGMFGRGVATGNVLYEFLATPEDVIAAVGRVLEFYRAEGAHGERLAQTLARFGERAKKSVLQSGATENEPAVH